MARTIFGKIMMVESRYYMNHNIILSFLVLTILSLGCAGCNNIGFGSKAGLYKEHLVEQTVNPPKLNGDWTGPVWGDVKAIEIKEYMGEKPKYLPRTQAKLLYDDKFVYVIFRVEDRYVRAVAQEYHGKVWEDSCVEFFFVTGSDMSPGYFNIEINCGGTMLFHHQTAIRENTLVVETADCDKVNIYHSLPKIIEPEIAEPTTWIIEYRVPVDVLEKYAPVARPAPGVIWQANFYKTASRTSNPHWVTWSVVDYPTPKFHIPRFFGTLIFK